MSGPVRVLEDGTRIYRNGMKYKPMDDADRTYRVRKPADPSAVRWRGVWFIPPTLLPETQRVMPETRPERNRYGGLILDR
jgi:hypothetical protein